MIPHSVTQAGMQWHNPGSLQPLPPGSSNSPASAYRVDGNTGLHHHIWIFFYIFSRNRVSPYWSGWSSIPDLLIQPPQPPKSMGSRTKNPGSESISRTSLLCDFGLSLALSPVLECSGATSVHCNLRLSVSSDFLASASQRQEFHHTGMAGLEPLTSGYLAASAYQRITGVSHRACPHFIIHPKLN
ncbi:hypothetical protein AAY473_012130, partial [Plecturocebus cupreus]